MQSAPRQSTPAAEAAGYLHRRACNPILSVSINRPLSPRRTSGTEEQKTIPDVRSAMANRTPAQAGTMPRGGMRAPLGTCARDVRPMNFRRSGGAAGFPEGLAGPLAGIAGARFLDSVLPRRPRI